MTPQSPAPVAGRPLTTEDCKLLQRGDVVAFGQLVGSLKGVADGWGCATLIAPNGAEFSRILHRGFTFIGRPDADGWMPWSGGENPVPGVRVEVKLRSGRPPFSDRSDDLIWSGNDLHDAFNSHDIIAFRLSRPASEQPVEAIGAGREEGGSFLLMKRGLYYRPNAQGYTGIKDYAGRYTAKEAADHSDPLSGVTAIAETEAPEFSPQCYDDQARAHLSKKLAEAEAKIAALSPASPARTPMGDKPEWLYLPEGEKPKDEGWQITHMTASSEEEGKRRIWVRNLTRSVLSAPTPMGGEVEALREAINLILPLAKGYVAKNNVGSNQSYVEHAEALAASSPSPAQGGDTELKPDFLRSLPGGSLDDSTFQAIEDALDRAEAPCRADGDKGRWLTLPERIAALSASPQPEAGEARIDYLRKSRDGHAATAHAEFGKRVMATDALISAREALHQHYVDWDGEPEDAVPLQEARAECDRVLDILLAAPPSVQPVEGK